MKYDMCLVDICTTNSIFREIYNVSTLTKRSGNISIIARRGDVIIDSTRVILTIPMGSRVLSKMLYCVSI